MDNYSKLIATMEELVTIYRHLLDLVRQEKEILVKADMEELTESNHAKEAMIIKMRSVEHIRSKCARELANEVGCDVENPRLVEIAAHLPVDKGEKLRSLHSVLDLLLKRVADFNKQNEALVESALGSVTGAMNSIKENLQGKPTYQNKGKKTKQGQVAGHLVKREV